MNGESAVGRIESFLACHGITEGARGVDLSRSILRHIADGPYAFHPYGFVALKLGAINHRYAAKLHVWLPAQRPVLDPNWPVHSHGKPLHSIILSGALTNETWSFSSAAQGSHRLYEALNEPGASTLVRTGIVGTPRLTSRATYEADQMYEVKTEQFHVATVEAGKTTATFAISGTACERPVHVVGDIAGRDRYENAYVEVNELALQDVRHVLLELFDGA